VRFEIRKVSFGRRIELARRIREIGRKAEFLEASGDANEKMDAAVMAAEIDGSPATLMSLIESGPVEIAAEMLAKIKRECGLTDDERKN
jgi:hypothetical protein